MRPLFLLYTDLLFASISPRFVSAAARAGRSGLRQLRHGEANTPAKAEQPLELPVVRLVAHDTVLTREYVADIQAVRNVELRARVKGYIEKIFVDEGHVVKKGQPLFQISAAEYRTRLARLHATSSNATAQARVAALQLERVKMLTAKNVITASELDVARAQLRAAEANVAEARLAESNAAYARLLATEQGRRLVQTSLVAQGRQRLLRTADLRQPVGRARKKNAPTKSAVEIVKL